MKVKYREEHFITFKSNIIQETLQSFVDTLFDSIFGLHKGGRVIPPCVKYLFDFLDAEAIDLNILDWEVHHTWKNNRWALKLEILSWNKE